MSTYATPADVEARLGRDLSQSETASVPVLLEDAESIIRARLKTLDALVAAGDVSEDTLVKVESWAVIRYLKNPDAKRSESIEDYSWTVDRALSEGRIYISDDEWSELLPATASTRAFSIDTAAGVSQSQPWIW